MWGEWFGLLVYWGLTPQQQPGSYQGGEMMMMMKSVLWWRKPVVVGVVVVYDLSSTGEGHNGVQQF